VFFKNENFSDFQGRITEDFQDYCPCEKTVKTKILSEKKNKVAI